MKNLLLLIPVVFLTTAFVYGEKTIQQEKTLFIGEQIHKTHNQHIVKPTAIKQAKVNIVKGMNDEQFEDFLYEIDQEFQSQD